MTIPIIFLLFAILAAFLGVGEAFLLKSWTPSLTYSKICMGGRYASARVKNANNKNKPRDNRDKVKKEYSQGRGQRLGQEQGIEQGERQGQGEEDRFSAGVGNSRGVNILGQNAIECRSFRLDGQRAFDFSGSYASIASLPRLSSPEIAVVGRSNVGKSSWLNCMTGKNKKIAVESKTPGRTQMLNLFNCKDTKGDICVFVDLPGYGFAKLAKSKQEEIGMLVRQYLEKRGALRLVVLLVDARLPPQAQDLGMAELLEHLGLDYTVVATKADKIKPSELSKNMAELRGAFGLPDGQGQPIAFSSVTGEGKRAMWRAIREGILGTGTGSSESDGGDGSEEYNEDEFEDEDE